MPYIMTERMKQQSLRDARQAKRWLAISYSAIVAAICSFGGMAWLGASIVSAASPVVTWATIWYCGVLAAGAMLLMFSYSFCIRISNKLDHQARAGVFSYADLLSLQQSGDDSKIKAIMDHCLFDEKFELDYKATLTIAAQAD